MLVALADEDEEGLISWEDFIPIGIDSIQTFFARNKMLQRVKAYERDLNKEALQLIYQDEIKLLQTILQKKFLEIDEKKEGVITSDQFRSVILGTNLFNPKEVNVILRNITSDTFEYETF